MKRGAMLRYDYISKLPRGQSHCGKLALLLDWLRWDALKCVPPIPPSLTLGLGFGQQVLRHLDRHDLAPGADHAVHR
jgi:hypothetical protein